MRRLDGAIVIGTAACAGALAFAAPIAAGAAAAIVLIAFARAGSRAIALLAALAFFAGAVRAGRAIDAHERARASLIRDGTWPSRCALRGVVARSPALVGEGLRVDVDVGAGECERGAFAGRVTLHVPLEVPLARGDRIEAWAELAPPYRFWNDTDPRPRQARRGVLLTGGAEDVRVLTHGAGLRAAIDRARARIRERILATYPDHAAAMARALVLGEDDLTAGDQRAFRQSGLAHLLAVSGMHLVLVVAGLVAAARAILVRIPAVAARVDATRLAAAMGVPIAWLYEDLAGASGSAERAAWMTTTALVAHAAARRPDAQRALGLSMIAMAALDPLAAFDLSFCLSIAATAGILALSPALSRALAERLPGWLAAASRPAATTAAATVACAPILAITAGELPLGGLVANLIAVPIGELAALPLCLAHPLLGAAPLAERGAALAASGALDLVRRIAHAFAALPGSQLPVPSPTPAELATLAAGAFGLLSRRWRWWAGGAAALLVLLEIGARRTGAPRGELRVTFFDVGQGDAALVDLPDGGAMLVDGGGLVGSPVDVGERVLGPALRARRRSAIDVVVLSHPHPDHYGGLASALPGVRVGALWDTGQGEAESLGGAYAALLAGVRARGAVVRRPRDLCGVHAIGGATVEVLAPCPAASPDRGPNDNSFVIRIRHGRRSFLFVGDGEREEEAGLLAARGSLRADVLKVGHHGSRTSTSAAWLDAVAPEVAVISCGIRNRFGHPHPSTLLALAARVPRVLRTDREGAVTVTTDGERLEARAAASP